MHLRKKPVFFFINLRIIFNASSLSQKKKKKMKKSSMKGLKDYSAFPFVKLGLFSEEMH